MQSGTIIPNFGSSDNPVERVDLSLRFPPDSGRNVSEVLWGKAADVMARWRPMADGRSREGLAGQDKPA
jgi:hypothetical protein